MLCFRVLLRAEKLNPLEIEHLYIGRIEPNPTPTPDSIKSFISDNIWAAC
jgi:hypothetical protein